MNSPPTPPYCGSVAAALHLMNSQIRCGSCREKVLFIALRWMQPDRGMMWQAENSELAREFPAGTASKARQSRLHQVQGVFPVFVFHSFVQFLNINVPKIVQFERFVFQNSTLRNTASWEVGKGERSKVKVCDKVKVGGKCFWVGIYLLLFMFHVRVRKSL